MKGHLSAKDLEKWKKADLQELAQGLEVSTEGTVKELAARIAAEEVEVPDEEENVSESDTAPICSSFRDNSAAYIYFLQRICVSLDIFCRSGTIKVLF